MAVPTAVAAPVTYAKSAHVPTADLTKFQPGNIISDAAFFNSSTMTEAQIQSFLEARVPNCQSGYTCLKDWYDTSRTTTADAMCGAYSGGVRERASRIIYKVAQACGINPQVILATLEKEQGLVRHTWPSEWRYTIAMGQGCPDTAACDTRYYGFFNQVYGAAWQFKRYANPAGTSQYFTWYAPGKTWNVRYNPNESCGSSPVYIQNQATANLYYYTPYQPNAAALRAGYGQGDGCSAYGNRNFYNFFTDWFGSTQDGQIAGLFSSGGQVWLLTGTTRYRVDAGVLSLYTSALGSARPIAASGLTRFVDRGPATEYIYSQARDEKSLLQSGRKHRFVNCAQVSLWGGDCATVTRLEPDVYDRIRAGGDVSDFARTEPGGNMYQITGATMWRVANMQHLIALAGGQQPFIGVMPARASSRFSFPSRIRFAPGLPIARVGSTQMYLATLTGKLHPISSSVARELGLGDTPTATVSGAWLNGFSERTAVSWLLGCESSVFLAAEGGRVRLVGGAPEGSSPTVVEDSSCSALGNVRREIDGPVFVRSGTSNEVYRLLGGTFRQIPEGARRAQEMNGNRVGPILSMSPTSIRDLPKGPAYPRSGTTVMVPGLPGKYLVDGGRLLLVSSAAISAGGIRDAVSVSPDTVRGLGMAGGELPHFIRCNGVDYGAGSASWSRVLTTGGSSPRVLSSTACAALRYGSPIRGEVFVTDGVNLAVASGGGFLRLNDDRAAVRAAGGAKPDVRGVGSWYFANLPQPSTAVRDGDIVSVPGEGGATVVSGGSRLAFAAPGAATDLALGQSRAVGRREVANYPLEGAVGVLVRCGSEAYVAGQGRLHALTQSAVTGYTVTALSDAICGRLTRDQRAPDAILLLRDRASGQVWVGTGSGKLRAVAEGETFAAANGGREPTPVVVEPGTVAALR
ncbi:hypothetical protein [Microbacterium aurantiacum]|uniref:hypothetical protein n=1 Tax=Microbacterium aurantiacum TaxID=162393 RepID=UPI000AEF9FFE|nr:hypothetical protein [Microbacterium chocolatum]